MRPEPLFGIQTDHLFDLIRVFLNDGLDVRFLVPGGLVRKRTDGTKLEVKIVVLAYQIRKADGQSGFQVKQRRRGVGPRRMSEKRYFHTFGTGAVLVGDDGQIPSLFPCLQKRTDPFFLGKRFVLEGTPLPEK